MEAIGYLVIALVVMVIAYTVYRVTFLAKPKFKHPHKPHFTLKIEPEA